MYQQLCITHIVRYVVVWCMFKSNTRIISKVFWYQVESTWKCIELIVQVLLTPIPGIILTWFYKHYAPTNKQFLSVPHRFQILKTTYGCCTFRTLQKEKAVQKMDIYLDSIARSSFWHATRPFSYIVGLVQNDCGF